MNRIQSGLTLSFLGGLCILLGVLYIGEFKQLHATMFLIMGIACYNVSFLVLSGVKL